MKFGSLDFWSGLLGIEVAYFIVRPFYRKYNEMKREQAEREGC